jgi:hypothetical protein
VAHLDDVYDESVIFDSVHDAILALTEPIAVLAGELLTPHRTRVLAELLDPLYDSLAILLSGNGLDFLHSRGFDQNPISSHYVSNP